MGRSNEVLAVIGVLGVAIAGVQAVADFYGGVALRRSCLLLVFTDGFGIVGERTEGFLVSNKGFALYSLIDRGFFERYVEERQ